MSGARQLKLRDRNGIMLKERDFVELYTAKGHPTGIIGIVRAFKRTSGGIRAKLTWCDGMPSKGTFGSFEIKQVGPEEAI